ncbi:uncharacterized protein LOC143876433 [Tasmannia lanceolata]|uniref:uncharacterized protein LOC143876433 n=1 Tax=Tasmannia lanceolata TaxID=3420 RepID=UPI0040646BE8
MLSVWTRKGRLPKLPARPTPVQDAPPKGSKPTVKIVGAYGRGAGSGHSAVPDVPLTPARPADNVFRPNWAVQKSDTGLGDSRVAREIITKGLLKEDKVKVLKEPPGTAEEAVFSSIYQIGCYYHDICEKSRGFSTAITRSEVENGRLKQEAEELKRSIDDRDKEIRRLNSEMATREEKALDALQKQRERAQNR